MIMNDNSFKSLPVILVSDVELFVVEQPDFKGVLSTNKYVLFIVEFSFFESFQVFRVCPCHIKLNIALYHVEY